MCGSGWVGAGDGKIMGTGGGKKEGRLVLGLKPLPWSGRARPTSAYFWALSGRFLEAVREGVSRVEGWLEIWSLDLCVHYKTSI